MKTYRLLGAVWFYGGLIAFIGLLFLVGEFWFNSGYIFKRGTASYLIYLALAVGLIGIGWGFLHQYSWARWPGYILSAIVATLSASFLLMVGNEFGLYNLLLSILIFLFSLCSIILIKIEKTP